MTRRPARLHPLSLAAACALLVSLSACGSNAVAQKPSQGAAPAVLPEDVKAVAAAVAPSPSSSPATPAGSGLQPASEAASASDGISAGSRLQLTGEFDTPMRSDLVVRWPGRVRKVLVDEGSRVREGQPLLELETEYLVLDAARAEAELSRAQSAAAETSRDYERKQELLAKGSVTKAIHDRSLASFEQATAAARSAEATLGIAKQKLSDAVLVAPFAGVIAEKHTSVGERLSDNTSAFVLVQTAPLKLRVRVPERYLSSVKTGLEVKASVDPWPGETFTGKVTVVSRSVDPKTRTFLMEALFPNRDQRLSPGLFARVETSGLGE